MADDLCNTPVSHESESVKTRQRSAFFRSSRVPPAADAALAAAFRNALFRILTKFDELCIMFWCTAAGPYIVLWSKFTITETRMEM